MRESSTIKIETYPAARGCHVRCGARQSIPSSSIDSCAAVRAILPSVAAGQTNRPRSSRFMSCHWSAIGPSDNGDARPLAVPPDHLEQIAAAAAEHEQMPAEGILLQHCLGLRASAANPLLMSTTPAASRGWHRDHVNRHGMLTP